MNNALTGRANLNVLVIDDDALAQKMVKKALEVMGVSKIEITSDGSAALEAVQLKKQDGEPYDLIIRDWEMPV